MGIKSKCKCVDDPYACLEDTEYVTQVNEADETFKSSPQPSRECDLSVLRGKRTLEEALMKRMRNFPPPFPDDMLEGRQVRVALVEDLREAGFGVVHTPSGKFLDDPHVSIVIPPDPAVKVLATWPKTPIDFPALLDSLFTV